MTEIKSKGIFLRPLRLEDANGNYPNWFNDKEVCKYNSHGDSLYTKQMAIDYINMVTTNSAYKVFAIVDEKNNKHIGNISLQHIDCKNNNAEFAIIIGEKDYYNKGYSKKAGILLFTYGFKELNLHRIYCGTSINNIPMQKLALSLGMKNEGQRIESFFKNGEYIDIVEFGILKKEFNEANYE